MNQTQQGGYEVNIEGQIHPWGKDTISVPEIRELGGFPPDSPVVAMNLEDRSEKALAENAVHQVVALEEGKPLVKRMCFKRAPGFEVDIEGRIYAWDKDTISVSEIRELGGLPANSPVVSVDMADRSEKQLSEDAVHSVVALQEGKPLTKRMSFKRG